MEPIVGPGQAAPSREGSQLPDIDLALVGEAGRPISGASPAGASPAGQSTADTSVPRMLVRLGFVVVFVGAAIALIASGYTAVAAVEVLFGAGLAAVEIIKRLG